jgi:hypothetical protein
VDARAEEPTKAKPIPFEAFITMLPLKGLSEDDLDELDFPFALIYYNKKKNQFEADADFIQEMRELEYNAVGNITREKKK